MKQRKNITISQTILERASEVMQARGFDDFSEFVSALVREEFERRGLELPTELKEGSPPYKTSGAATTKPQTTTAEEETMSPDEKRLVEIVKQMANETEEQPAGKKPKRSPRKKTPAKP